jgi:hypothetical protein
MLQILYERGWICEEHLDRYKKKVVDDAGLIVKEYSLGNILEACTDLTNEKTQLEYVCGLVFGVIISHRNFVSLDSCAANGARFPLETPRSRFDDCRCQGLGRVGEMKQDEDEDW